MSTATVSPIAKHKADEAKAMSPRAPETLRIPTWLASVLIGILITTAGNFAQQFYWKGSVDTKIEAYRDALIKKDAEVDYMRAQFQVISNQFAELKGELAATRQLLQQGRK